MGYFKRSLHKASDTGEWYYIYEPTIFKKKGTVYVKDKHSVFIRRLKQKPRSSK